MDIQKEIYLIFQTSPVDWLLTKVQQIQSSNVSLEDKISKLIAIFRCSSTQIPLYQIRGLTRNVFLANVASEQSTVVSFDGGVNWNKTYYQCDQVCSNHSMLDSAYGFVIDDQLFNKCIYHSQFLSLFKWDTGNCRW